MHVIMILSKVIFLIFGQNLFSLKYITSYHNEMRILILILILFVRMKSVAVLMFGILLLTGALVVSAGWWGEWSSGVPMTSSFLITDKDLTANLQMI